MQPEIQNTQGLESAVLAVAQAILASQDTAWSDYIPSLSGGGSMTVSSIVINSARYKQVGKTVFFSISISFTTGGTANPSVIVTLPISSAASYGPIGAGSVAPSGSGRVASWSYLNTANDFLIRRYDSTNYGLGANNNIDVTGQYEAA